MNSIFKDLWWATKEENRPNIPKRFRMIRANQKCQFQVTYKKDATYEQCTQINIGVEYLVYSQAFNLQFGYMIVKLTLVFNYI